MMLDQFRNYYPQGSLISELITIDHGKYIVRALIQVDGVILGTGLAGDNIIEVAEDRAIDRALKSVESTVKSSIKLDSVNYKNNLDTEFKDVILNPSEKLIESSNIEENKQNNNDFSEPGFRDLVEIKEYGQEVANFGKTVDKRSNLQEDDTSHSLPNNDNTFFESNVDNESLDFSEIIARSNIELKRVKWTTEQGRDYLIKTYEKRSRQVLSDKELLDFLHYLENLPTPT
ncbi:hypothetical protein [Candidatus Atelocyanobacterium thalassae]|uniref:Uncharacterized protein n=2 Tax=Candidatus Atelocyanobacterium thalassae TaxID=713887 RepID=A0A086CFI9_9CHRO|nr:hypothetical protein [Candidatus Atelocyanobacterium thalassa]KFF40953.1 MAG: hypothetical protein ucyna2_01238 [Candidatus Atelocyanobacterium thalassa isolate SIO64986]BDA39384.1 hypothetical protein CPARK_000022300 [cyanobacterium endosymbiont of Braarudosphaera bigelowii]